MTIARVVNGVIAELREIDFAAVPAHKQHMWRPVVIEGSGPNEETIVEANQVRIVRTGPTIAQLKARAQERRRALEIGGAIIGGVAVYTDPESQAKLHAARTAAKEDAGYTVKWKTSAGTFATLDATTIIALADGVRAHVQACFAAEEAVVIKIQDAVYATYDQVDQASEWSL